MPTRFPISKVAEHTQITLKGSDQIITISPACVSGAVCLLSPMITIFITWLVLEELHQLWFLVKVTTPTPPQGGQTPQLEAKLLQNRTLNCCFHPSTLDANASPTPKCVLFA
jgi:hypothetical protein